ncbi:MAG: EamA family transporter [Oscillospiraceae bacterium]|nr:EamA family transporter [Oscillospiraceae bacterium]
MKHSEKRYYLYLHLLMLLMSFSGVVSKTAAAESFLSLRWILLYGLLLLILAVYAVFWQQLLRHIMLSRAYACKSVNVVWGMLWGVLFFHERLTVKQLLAGVLVIAGVVLVASGKEQHDNTD